MPNGDFMFCACDLPPLHDAWQRLGECYAPCRTAALCRRATHCPSRRRAHRSVTVVLTWCLRFPPSRLQEPGSASLAAPHAGAKGAFDDVPASVTPSIRVLGRARRVPCSLAIREAIPEGCTFSPFAARERGEGLGGRRRVRYAPNAARSAQPSQPRAHREQVDQRPRFGTGGTEGSCRNPQDNNAKGDNAGGGKSVGHWRFLEPDHANQRRKDHRGFPQG